jgi:hypothetical protein
MFHILYICVHAGHSRSQVDQTELVKKKPTVSGRVKFFSETIQSTVTTM